MAQQKVVIAQPGDSPDLDDDFIHYYDQHPTREDLMGESSIQFKLIVYLVQVLEWLYHDEGWFVISNLNIYRFRQRHEYPIAPDVAVFKDVIVANPAARTFRSWRLYEPNRPAPQVVFEICSDTTWKDDLREKPAKYAALGVQEYVAYDPNDPPYFPKRQGRLRGWRRVNDTLVEQTPDTQGRLWSDELASYLVADSAYLRLTDRDGRLRLTQAEAAERARSAAETGRAAERAAKEAERAAKEAAWAKLRELGIDPTSL